MSVIQSKRETLEKEDYVVQAISLLESVLSDEEVSQLTPWFPEIEETARELVRQLKPNETRALHPLAVASAALYDSFLHFESRTAITIVFTRFKEATDLSVHRIQKVWKRFFDNRTHLDIRKLTAIDITDNDTPSSLIPTILSKIRGALDVESETIDMWLSSVEAEALALIRNPSFGCEEAPEVIAAASVYEGVNRHNGKKLVHLPHRLLRRISGWGEAKIARVTKELFSTS
ncbi:MAG: hypothetical protein ACFFEM_13205 [Candidatus Thorarchaeota archaeon]